MADGWTEHADAGSGRSYYYHAASGTTSWDPPPGWGASAAADTSEWQEVPDASSGRSYYYNATTGVTQWDPPPGFGGSSSSGGAAARVTSDEPASSKKSSAGRKSMMTRRSGIAKRNTAKPTTVGDKLAARAKKFVAMRKGEKAKNQPSSFARKRGASVGKALGGAAAALPADWQAATTDDGKTYYYNSATGETSWTLPS